jgi:hypothetical protein
MEIFLIWLGFVRLKPKEISTALDQTRLDVSLVRHPELVSGSRVLINKHVRP